MTKHWFIAHLIEKFSKGKTFGLDIGIGTDNWLEFKKCEMIGIDKKNSKYTDVCIELEGGLPFKDESFDVVIAINSLNFVKKGRFIMDDIFRVMKKNAIFVCVVDNEKSITYPNVWEQRYLDRVLQVTGFKNILKKNLKDYFYAKWYNYGSVYAFAVVEKPSKIIHKKPQVCSKCGNTLYSKPVKDSITGKYIHKKCPEPVSKKAKSYNVITTHPDG